MAAHYIDHEGLVRCVGSDSPALCLACGTEFMVDSKMPTAICPARETTKITDLNERDGRRCPFCKAGVFEADSDLHRIS